MSSISTHVLDLSRGRPAQGVVVVLDQRLGAESWTELSRGATDGDGRISRLAPESLRLATGVYRLRFATGPYFAEQGSRCFFPEVAVIFEVEEPAGHFHIPLLISPYGYSTYRGS